MVSTGSVGRRAYYLGGLIMRDYILYGIQPRLYSSNVVIGLFKEDGKIKSDLVLIPVQAKAEGDLFAEHICRLLNEHKEIGNFIKQGGF
jgi:hypothetical protein